VCRPHIVMAAVAGKLNRATVVRCFAVTAQRREHLRLSLGQQKRRLVVYNNVSHLSSRTLLSASRLRFNASPTEKRDRYRTNSLLMLSSMTSSYELSMQ